MVGFCVFLFFDDDDTVVHSPLSVLVARDVISSIIHGDDDEFDTELTLSVLLDGDGVVLLCVRCTCAFGGCVRRWSSWFLFSTGGDVGSGGIEVGVVVGDILRMDLSFCSCGLWFFFGCGDMDC